MLPMLFSIYLVMFHCTNGESETRSVGSPDTIQMKRPKRLVMPQPLIVPRFIELVDQSVLVIRVPAPPSAPVAVQ